VLDRVIFDVFDPGAVTFAYVRSGILFAANLIIAWITVALLRRQWSQRPARVPVGQPRPVARPPEVSAEAQSTVS